MSLCRYLPTPSDRMAIIWSLLSIKDSIVLEYGPAGTTHYSMGLYGTLGIDFQQVLFTTHMSEDDVVMGDVRRLEEAIVELDKSYNPKVIFVVASSISAVIGTDLKGICNYMQREIRANLVPFEQGGFKGDYSFGLLEVYKTLADNLTKNKNTNTIKENTYNIIGASMSRYRMASDVWEIKNLLRETFNFKAIACLCCETSVDEIANMGEAMVNIVLSYEGIPAAEILKQKFGTPYIYCAPYGYRQTLGFLKKVESVTGVCCSDKVIKRIKAKQSGINMYGMPMMMGRRNQDLQAIIKGDYDLVKNLSEFVDEAGIKVSNKICSHSLKYIDDYQESIKFYPDEKDMLDILRAAKKKLVLADDVSIAQCDDTNVKLRVSFPFIEGSQIATHMPLMGEKGADYLLETIDKYYQNVR